MRMTYISEVENVKNMDSTAVYVMNSKGHIVKVENFDPDSMVLRTLSPDMKATPEQIAMLKDASRHPIVYEEDCPELTPAMAEAFRKAARAHDLRKKIGCVHTYSASEACHGITLSSAKRKISAPEKNAPPVCRITGLTAGHGDSMSSM